ncbi:DNA replication and repair protein RecF [Burkholderia aenigmatica]|uniref:DNA replication and repair protein RecF n=2 Tax=Burkholderiaceae TaxID=119060 RepID=A0A6J5IVW9_9BURK|nr:DNA replication and repair protein RecF [Burkholderia aenigmatica]
MAILFVDRLSPAATLPMYIDNVSIKNFGPFSAAGFAFSGRSVTFVVGGNASGKTQLCGAIVAAIVGRSAIRVREGATGPSHVTVTLIEDDLTEVSTLSVSADSRGQIAVSHAPCPLAMRILTTMSDPDGPCLLLAEESMGRSLVKGDWEVIERLLPDRIRQGERWSRLSKNGTHLGRLASQGEQALMSLLWEFVVRKKANLRLPLLVDDIAMRWDYATRNFALEILDAISELSQVIVFSSRQSPLIGGEILELVRPKEAVTSLAGYNDRSFMPRRQTRARRQGPLWIRGGKFPRQENRSCELKEIKGANPIASIKSLVDQYAVAFMNSGRPQDGSVFWGIRDEDLSIIGVSLTDRDCDELRRVVTEKLHQIVPSIAPTAYQVELHPVSDGIKPIDNLYLVEVRIPAMRRTLLFATGSQEVYVKTDAGKRRLSAVEIQYELLRRVGIDPTF